MATIMIRLITHFGCLYAVILLLISAQGLAYEETCSPFDPTCAINAGIEKEIVEKDNDGDDTARHCQDVHTKCWDWARIGECGTCTSYCHYVMQAYEQSNTVGSMLSLTGFRSILCCRGKSWIHVKILPS